ncbi:exopolysaccharide biosynthesis polyprenyl glycosylphosphotransferase [Streptomyces sp. NPDC003327]
MTTESTSVPSSPGPWPAAGQTFGLASLAPLRGAPDRVSVPRHRAVRTRSGVPALIAADCLAVLTAAVPLTAVHRDARLLLPVLLLVLLLDGHGGLYRPAAHVRMLDELPALASRAGFTWCLAAAAVAAYSPSLAFGPLRLCAAYAAHVGAVCAVRGLLLARRRRVARAHPRSALVVGGHAAARRFASAAVQHPEYGVRPVGIVGVPEQGGAPRTPGEPGLPVLTTTEEIHRAVIQNAVRDAVFLDDDPGLVTLFQQYGCATWRVGGRHQDGPMGEHMWGYAWRRIAPAEGERHGRTAKRALDIALAVPALVLALPVLALCALAVRLSDGPGILFRQERIGQHGRPFTLLKFRTLRPSDDSESATRWSVAGDRRMSAAGSFLRKSSLDELPQLWNVLRGDMSLVGPRPERPYFVAQFSKVHPGYADRHRMPVGLTGLAQVHGLRGDTSIEDRCRFDNHYIDHWSLWQDVCILIRTAVGLVRPTGS